MTLKADILARFSGDAEGRPIYLPDLTLWYDWHHRRGTLPDGWQGYSLAQVARALGVPVWLVARPWRVETPGVEVVVNREGNERVVRYAAPSGTLTARWKVGPDGDWWQVEYPVKTEADLSPALELVQARSYVFEPGELADLQAEAGDDGLLAVEIPRRAYSDLLHQFLGWGEGLLLLGEPAIPHMIAALELKLQDLAAQVAGLPGDLILSPDNLDGQFISPGIFKAYLAGSYRLTAETLRMQHKPLVVHVGGPVRHLLALLAGAGVDGVEGIAGPPQADASLAVARQIAGPALTLWGGIPQDLLLPTHPREEFQAAVGQAAREALGDRRMILGVADRVPVDAELSRLQAIPALVDQAVRDG
jgi:hypothetical protein